MKKTKSIYLALVAVLLLPLAANAIPTGVLIQNGDEVIIDFDLTGLFTGSLTTIIFGATFDSSDPVAVNVDNIQTLIFGDVGGNNLIQTRNDSIGPVAGFVYNAAGTEYGPLSTANPIFNPMLDGVFSIGFRANSGSSAIVSSIFVIGRYAGGETPRVEISLVPEPGTLALLGIGLLGMGAARRRKKV